jgi:inner membrane protein
MDNLTHSLVGLSLAKAGLERVSPYAATVCLLSANAADADFVSLFFGDRWTLLHHHRGITHSIVGTIAIGFLVPLIVAGVERIAARIRGQSPTIRVRGLIIASFIAAATHPLMDWMNNYGVRPLLPWSNKWFYGDLVYIIDPYIWLILGGVTFLLTSDEKWKLAIWSVLGFVVTALIGLAAWRSGSENAVRFAFVVWIFALVCLIRLRAFGTIRRFGRVPASAALAVLLGYCGALAIAHRAAFANARSRADSLASSKGERLIRVAAMPTTANPFVWQSVAETDRAMYRFRSGPIDDSTSVTTAFNRYEKPTGPTADLVSSAERDRRAREFLLFARFPIAEPLATACVGQTLVQFADIRYTEPGATRGTFSVNIPVDCPAR